MNDVARRECAENCFNNAGRRATAFSSVDSFRLYDLAPWHAPYAPIPSITRPNQPIGRGRRPLSGTQNCTPGRRTHANPHPIGIHFLRWANRYNPLYGISPLLSQPNNASAQSSLALASLAPVGVAFNCRVSSGSAGSVLPTAWDNGANMNFENTIRLWSQFPAIFSQTSLGRQLSDDAFPPVGCPIECGDGWLPLLERLCRAMCVHAEATGVGLAVTQIKEKFGMLRIYVDGGDEEVERLIDEGELESATICELCGAPGAHSDKGWCSTRCGPCRRNA